MNIVIGIIFVNIFCMCLTMFENAIAEGCSVHLSHSWSTLKRFKISKHFSRHTTEWCFEFNNCKFKGSSRTSVL